MYFLQFTHTNKQTDKLEKINPRVVHVLNLQGIRSRCRGSLETHGKWWKKEVCRNTNRRLDGKDKGKEWEICWMRQMEGVIGHHRALGQLFFDILVDTMTQSQPAVTENRDPVFLKGKGGGSGGRTGFCHLWMCDGRHGGWAVVSKITSMKWRIQQLFQRLFSFREWPEKRLRSNFWALKTLLSTNKCHGVSSSWALMTHLFLWKHSCSR